MDPLELPVSVVLALWAPLPSSRGPALVQGPDGAHEVHDGAMGGAVPLEEWLPALGPLMRCAAVLPSTADPLPGLALALDAGEGVLLESGGDAGAHGSGVPRRVLLVPEDSGTSVLWLAHDLRATPPPFDASQARRDVHRATEEAIESLVALDLARERPELADTLTDLVTAVLDPGLVPPSLDGRRRELLERSLRLEAICDLALEDDGAAATALQARRRAEVLRPLLAVARRGVAAATETWAVTGR
ncbi:hypothetical protein [Actinomyces radicidentis]|uniref:hypothetical protein n=1 Tax=Actinomyces radicidentis TaxID=111015 RepID=UPI0028E2D83C|nr:hypothetical protein [Actinomyces radicidentis]